MCDIVVKRFTFAISFPDEFLSHLWCDGRQLCHWKRMSKFLTTTNITRGCCGLSVILTPRFEMSLVHVLSQIWRHSTCKAFHTRGPVAEKLLSPKCCVCMERHYSFRRGRSWRRLVWSLSWILDARYAGVFPVNDWCTRYASLNSTRRRQCNFCRTGVICSQYRVSPVMRRAASPACKLLPNVEVAIRC